MTTRVVAPTVKMKSFVEIFVMLPVTVCPRTSGVPVNGTGGVFPCNTTVKE